MGFPSMMEDIQARRDDGLSNRRYSSSIRQDERFVDCKYCGKPYLKEAIADHTERCRIEKIAQRQAELESQKKLAVKYHPQYKQAPRKSKKTKAPKSSKAVSHSYRKSVPVHIPIYKPTEVISRKRFKKLLTEAFETVSPQANYVLLSVLYKAIAHIEQGFHPHKYGHDSLSGMIQSLAKQYTIRYLSNSKGVISVYVVQL